MHLPRTNEVLIIEEFEVNHCISTIELSQDTSHNPAAIVEFRNKISLKQISTMDHSSIKILLRISAKRLFFIILNIDKIILTYSLV